MAALTVKIGADTTLLGRGLAMAESKVKGFSKSLGRLGVAGIGAGVAGLGAAFAASAIGIKKVLDVGGRLSDVAANTGLLAGEVAVLEKAFSDAGLSISAVPTAIAKMQKTMVDATEGNDMAAESFSKLGLSAEALRAMPPARQFEAIASAISAIEDPAERTARATEILGRAGKNLGAVFANQNAIKEAGETLGSQAEILNKNAAIFDRASDLLGSVGTKLQGFFAGMAEQITPTLLAVLEQLNKIDLAKYGQAAGQMIALIAEAFRSGKLPRLLGLGMLGAAKDFVNFMLRGVLSYGAALAAGVGKIPNILLDAVKILGKADLWLGIAEAAYGAFSGMIVKLLGNLPAAIKDAIPGLDSFLSSGAIVSSKAMVSSGNRLGGLTAPLRDELADTGRVMREAFEDSFRTLDDILGSQDQKNEISKIIAGLKQNLETLKKTTQESYKAKTAAVLGGDDLTARRGFTAPVVGSLARVGGASGARAMMSLDNERNNLLKRIVTNTGRPRVAKYA